MILDILKYVLGSFWRFIGFSFILYITLFFITNGVVQLFDSFTKIFKSKL